MTGVPMANHLSGKVVAITGGARGIGFATARTLVRQGARVAIGDVDAAALAAARDELALPCALRLDVRDPESWAEFLDGVTDALGPIDVLVNNAGVMPVGRLRDESDDSTRRMIDINLYGVIVGSKLAAARMAQRSSGHVVNIASMAGEVPSAGLATYSATKAGVVAFTHAARLEHRGSGVHFSAIAPSFVNTELTSGTEGVKGMRNASPEEIADAVVSVLKRPRAIVRRTRAMAALVGTQRFMPRGLNEAIARGLGADSVFLDSVDRDARAAYEDRVAER